MKIIMKTFYKVKTPEDSLLVLTRQNYSATAYTETCFLSRPLRSNLTTPSILANNVSSPPRPTFSPG